MEWKSEIIQRFHCSQDLATLDIKVGTKKGSVIFLDGMTELNLLLESVIKPMNEIKLLEPPYYKKLLDILDNVASFTIIDESQAVEKIANGDIVISLEGSDEKFLVSLRKYPTRAIQEPPTSAVLKGPREGFVEDMKINQILVRRRLRTPDLVFNTMQVGRYTRTSVTVCYIDGVADKKILNSVIKRIKAINIDGILDSSYITKYLEERPHSLFRQVGTTEKPDIFTAKLLEGRIGIIVDGSPICLTLPFIIWESFQDSQDYFRNETRSTFLRLLRILGEFIAILLPALFVAIQEYHYQMIPMKFLLTIMTATSGIPLTPTIEMLAVLVLFDILNEASVRMPKYVGMALSVVGAIVLGDTAVKAGILSSPAVLATAVSSIGMYCVPDQAGVFSMFRLLFVLVASVLGIFGIILGIIFLFAYLVEINSYGSPYVSPFTPFIKNDMQDAVVKENLIDMLKRPRSIRNVNETRAKREDRLND